MARSALSAFSLRSTPTLSSFQGGSKCAPCGRDDNVSMQKTQRSNGYCNAILGLTKKIQRDALLSMQSQLKSREECFDLVEN